jgi:hypothetical protein
MLMSLSLLLLSIFPLRAQNEQVPSDVSFSLRRSFLQSLLTGGPNSRTVGARWKISLELGDHSGVHDLGGDCELHVAGRFPNNRIIADPAGLVAEPPNVCKARLPEIQQNGGIEDAWQGYFDDHVTGKTCEVTGFPRIFTEHSTGGKAGSSNPDHVVEVHPAIGLDCGEGKLDFLSILKAYPGMRQISEKSARACIDERQLFVRQRGSGSAIRYEFLEKGAKGANGTCGNFAVVEAHIGKEYLRTLTNGGDHVALGQVWIGEDGPFPLKIYTYKGTPEDGKITHLMDNADTTATVEIQLHGLLTYDYFTIAQALQDPNRQWLNASALHDYKEISRPLAMVVFGEASE